MVDVACVLKSGGDFDAEYVERLRDGVKKHLGPHRFVCLSDVDVPCERIALKYDLPGWWSKMELFRPDIDLGDVFYIDLDTVVVGDLTPLTVMDLPRMINGGQSSMMALPKYCRPPVWEKWIESPDKHMKEFGHDEDRRDIIKRGVINYDLSNIGDQAFIRRELKMHDFPYGFLCSYLELAARQTSVRGPTIITRTHASMPKTLAAIIFNNRPRPRDVAWLKNMEIFS